MKGTRFERSVGEGVEIIVYRAVRWELELGKTTASHEAQSSCAG